MKAKNGISRRFAGRRLCLLLSLVLILLTMPLPSAYAMQDTGQHKTNPAEGHQNVYSVFLFKYELPEDETTPPATPFWKPTDGPASSTSDTPAMQPVPNTAFSLYRRAPGAEPERLGGPYVTDAYGQLSLSGLLPGDYYFMETRPAYGYTWAASATDLGQPVTEYPFTIAEGADPNLPIWVRAYNTRLNMPLTIKKEVRDYYGASPTDLRLLEQPFEFTVTFSDGGAYDYRINGGEVKTLASGGTLSLRHAEEAVFEGLPVGLHYTVRETPTDGFTTTCYNHCGNVLLDEATITTFVNTSTVPAGSLSVAKKVRDCNDEDDYEPEEGKAFTFNVVFGGIDHGPLYYSIDGGPPQLLPDDGAFQLMDGQTATFDDLPEGTTYTVTEGPDPAYAPTPESYTGTVAADETKLSFVNVLLPPPSPDDMGMLMVGKDLSGTDARADDTFEFDVDFSEPGDHYYTIADSGVAQLLTEGEPLSMLGGQRALFYNLTPGITFTVAERAPSTDGYITKVGEVSGTIVGATTVEAIIENHRNIVEPDADTSSLTIRKNVLGDPPPPLDNKAFNFTLTIDAPGDADDSTETFTLADGEEKLIAIPFGASYHLEEDDAYTDGFVLTSFERGSGSATEEEIIITATNTYVAPGMVLISGEKTWDFNGVPNAVLPAGITVQLKNGDDVVETKTVSPDGDGNWRYAFVAPKFEDDGVTEINYTIGEVTVPGYVTTVSGTSLTNTRIATTSYSPLAKKQITGDVPLAPATFYFDLDPLGGAPAPAVTELAIAGAGSGAFPAILFTSAGEYSYNITERAGSAPGYTYDTAAWTLKVTVEQQGTALVVTDTEYTRGGPDTYTEAAFSNSFDAAQVTQVSVSKAWVLPDDTPIPDELMPPDEILVQLYGNGAPFGVAAALNDGNGWSHTFNGLNPAMAWTVDEVAVPEGYEREITGSAAGGFLITNTLDYKAGPDPAEEVVIAGEKTWKHGSNPEENWPESITIQAKNGNYVAAQKTVTAADNWSWTFELPALDENEKVIKYKIAELPVPGYKASVKGYNVTNTFGSGSGGDPPGDPGDPGGTGGAPQTGDPSPWALWLLLATAGPFALRFVLFHPWPKKSAKKRVKYRRLPHG